MSGFANAASGADRDRALHALLWLAGLLEAEGSFMKPPPSEPALPIVACAMTDRDVVERVAERFGTSVMANSKGRYRTEYVAKVKGSRAAALMADLRPFMGTRRQTAIDRALASYVRVQTKLGLDQAQQIRHRYAGGESVSSLARRYSVTRPTIRAVLQGRIYRAPPRMPWRSSMTSMPEPGWAPFDLSHAELYWLAGWLEGEGSFCAPPPCDPWRPRVMAQTRDHDVALEAARLLGVAPVFSHSERARSRGWSPMWRLLKQGRGAVIVMEALLPAMGERRTTQINAALDIALEPTPP